MKQAIHPTFYTDTKVTCLCGNVFSTGSTVQDIRVEVCSNCHPVYTGVKRFVDTLGRVDKFVMAQQKAGNSPRGLAAKKKKQDEASSLPQQKSLKEMLEDAKQTA